MNKYRDRIYAHYVAASDKSTVPRSVKDFEGRAPTMQYVIGAFFPPEKSAAILDLGCGHGTLVHFARAAGYFNIQGVDVSAQQVNLAHQLGISNIQQGDLVATLKATPLASLDAVVAFDVIEHFTKDELIDLVDAVHRVLKPGGRWLLHTPNGASPFFGAVRYGDFTHEQAFTSSSLLQLFRASGFSHMEFAECSPSIHGIKSFLRFVIWRLVRIAYQFVLAVETGVFRKNMVLTQNLFAVAYKSRQLRSKVERQNEK